MSAPGWRTWWSSPRAISKKDSRSGRSSGRSTTVGRGHHLAVGRVSIYLVELSSALGGYSKWLPPLGVILTSLARVPGRPQKHLSGEFRVSPRYLLCGVSLPGGGSGGVGVDERVEGASGRPTWFILLDVDQVEQAAQICPPVERHLSVASFDDPDQASDEVEAVRT